MAPSAVVVDTYDSLSMAKYQAMLNTTGAMSFSTDGNNSNVGESGSSDHGHVWLSQSSLVSTRVMIWACRA